jgi:hypothetical protein
VLELCEPALLPELELLEPELLEPELLPFDPLPALLDPEPLEPELDPELEPELPPLEPPPELPSRAMTGVATKPTAATVTMAAAIFFRLNMMMVLQSCVLKQR